MESAVQCAKNGYFAQPLNSNLIFSIGNKAQLLKLLFTAPPSLPTSRNTQQNKYISLKKLYCINHPSQRVDKNHSSDIYEAKRTPVRLHLKKYRNNDVLRKIGGLTCNNVAPGVVKTLAAQYRHRINKYRKKIKVESKSVTTSGAPTATEQVDLGGERRPSAQCATRDAALSGPALARRKQFVVLFRLRCSYFNKRQPVSSTVIISHNWFSTYYLCKCTMNTPGPEELSPATDDEGISFMGFSINDIQDLTPAYEPATSSVGACPVQDVCTFNASGSTKIELPNEISIPTRSRQIDICEVEEQQTSVEAPSNGMRASVAVVRASSYPTRVFHPYSRTTCAAGPQLFTAPAAPQQRFTAARPASCLATTPSTDSLDGRLAYRRFTDFGEPSLSRLNSKFFPKCVLCSTAKLGA
ncbi:unnamed protein product [Toxocara canis]|uniref:Uncharacterized protein n=1 Tax=Toxocara canis TaxID=6265 RepID=A0A183V482_TOXCA|nr:unnamed protein product [Toxocara canis]